MNDSERELLLSGSAALGVALDHVALERFSTYLALLQLWGKKINLTARLDAREVVIYHFLDSLAAVPIFKDTPEARVVDLGAGAGLPALPLKFAMPGLRVLLVESVRKKIAFCQEVIRATGIAQIAAVWGRGEEVGARTDHHRSYDWAVSRALGAAADVACLALPFLAPGGRLLLYKGEPESGELKALDAFCTQAGGTWESRPVTVPHLKAARCLIIATFP